jgi:hypothetical protein
MFCSKRRAARIGLRRCFILHRPGLGAGRASTSSPRKTAPLQRQDPRSPNSSGARDLHSYSIRRIHRSPRQVQQRHPCGAGTAGRRKTDRLTPPRPARHQRLSREQGDERRRRGEGEAQQPPRTWWWTDTRGHGSGKRAILRHSVSCASARTTFNKGTGKDNRLPRSSAPATTIHPSSRASAIASAASLLRQEVSSTWLNSAGPDLSQHDSIKGGARPRTEVRSDLAGAQRGNRVNYGGLARAGHERRTITEKTGARGRSKVPPVRSRHWRRNRCQRSRSSTPARATKARSFVPDVGDEVLVAFEKRRHSAGGVWPRRCLYTNGQDKHAGVPRRDRKIRS